MEIPLSFNLKTEQHFFVKSILPSTVIDKHITQKFTHKLSPSFSEVINVEIVLSKKHFIFGETVEIVAKIDNQSKSTIESIETGVQTKISYKGKATDSWRGKYFEASESEDIDFFVRKNKLFVQNGQNYCFKRNFGIENIYPSISDTLINVKHWIFVKLGIKIHSTTSVLTFTIPVKIYTDNYENDFPFNYEEDVFSMSNLSHNENPLLYLNNQTITTLLKSNISSSTDTPPAYSEIDNFKLLFTSKIPTTSLPPKYEETFAQKF